MSLKLQASFHTKNKSFNIETDNEEIFEAIEDIALTLHGKKDGVDPHNFFFESDEDLSSLENVWNKLAS